MKLINKFSNKEIKLLSDAGIKIEDREYSQEELKKYELNIEEFIMNHSTKNGDISKLSNEYRDILNVLMK